MTSHKNKLLSWFKDGSLINPNSKSYSSINLTHALANLTNSKVDKPCSDTSDLMQRIGKHKHYIFIILDGFGCNSIEKLPKSSFLKSNLKEKMISVFPSSTAPSLTSIYTGTWPSLHGVPGWWTYIKEIDKITCPLPFVVAADEVPLEKYNLSPKTLFLQKSIFTSPEYETKFFLPNKLVDSSYSKYSRGSATAQGYSLFEEGLEQIATFIKNSSGNTYSYLYTNEPDSTFHHKGPSHPNSISLIASIDSHLETFHKSLPKNVKTIISSDHGALDIPSENNYLINDDSPLMPLLASSPAGEPRVTMFHVKTGKQQEFFDEFNRLYGKDFALISSIELDELALLGPGKLSNETKERVGDFIAISNKSITLQYASNSWKPAVFMGAHGGLSHEEVEIPLIII
jgi:predicted AlkP superfamily pyrophosphatase or phosphodiesterase